MRKEFDDDKRNDKRKQERIPKMDMRKYVGANFVTVDDVHDGPLQVQIAVVKEGKYNKANLVFGRVPYQGDEIESVIVEPISSPVAAADKAVAAEKLGDFNDEIPY